MVFTPRAARRGYAFAVRKITPAHGSGVIAVTRGQLTYEWSHLMAKLAIRDPELGGQLAHVGRPQPHPSFCLVPGDVETWEKRPGTAAQEQRAADSAARRGRRPLLTRKEPAGDT